jgi:hypothetical protein
LHAGELTIGRDGALGEGGAGAHLDRGTAGHESGARLE